VIGVNRKMAEQAAETLGLANGYGKDDVVAAYRNLAKECHPDKGGDIAKFTEIDRAKCILLKWLETPASQEVVFVKPDCPNCKGIGRIKIRKGFGILTITCGRCQGSGDADWDADVQDT
jgi:DnaJ-class molecular chaperone